MNEASEQSGQREAPENAAAQQEQQAPEEGQPDTSDAIASIKDTLQRMEQNQQPEDSEGSLSDFLIDYEDEEPQQPAPQGEQPYQPQEYGQPDPTAMEVAEIKQYLAAQEQQRAQQYEQQQIREINALEDKYPDIRDNLSKVNAVIDRMEADAGGELPLTASLIENVYKAVKADAASATEIPAEEARSSGASLETNAGASTGEGEQSEEDQIRNAILNAKGPSSVFTR